MGWVRAEREPLPIALVLIKAAGRARSREITGAGPFSPVGSRKGPLGVFKRDQCSEPGVFVQMIENLRTANQDCTAIGGSDPWLIDNPESGLPCGDGGSVVSKLGKNHLYFGDNLDILREYIPDESVDLVYLDPPFNSQAQYNLLFERQDDGDSSAQAGAFRDTWRWGDEAEWSYQELMKIGGDTARFVAALRAALTRSSRSCRSASREARTFSVISTCAWSRGRSPSPCDRLQLR